MVEISTLVCPVATECSQAATAAASGIPEADGGEAGAAPETAAIPFCRPWFGLGPRQWLSGGGARSFWRFWPQQPQHHPPRFQPLQPLCVWARKLSLWTWRRRYNLRFLPRRDCRLFQLTLTWLSLCFISRGRIQYCQSWQHIVPS